MSEDSLIKKLMTAVKCSVCGHCYESTNIDIIGHEEDLWFLKAFCPSCSSESLMAAVVEEKIKIESISDLNPSEINKFTESALTQDDILDMHNFLKDYHGDFHRLLK